MSDSDTAKILVVDDLAEKLLVYETILEELGQQIYTAHSGSEALRLILQHEFAVVLLDVNMPDMDGFETAAMIRSRSRSAHTPIIFLTAFADEIRINEAYERGAVDFILTPVVPEVLRAKVRVFVDLFRMTAQVRRQAQEQLAIAQERARLAAAEEANLRLGFLAKAGAILGQSLDPEVSARDALMLAVPGLADLAILVQFPATGERRGLSAQLREGVVAIEESSGETVTPEEFLRLVEGVATEGAPLGLWGGIPAALDAEPDAIAIPLQARGQQSGVMILSRVPSKRLFTVGDVALCEAFASRCAIAMENAELFCEVEQANRQKNEFLSMLAHELRNPLAPILSAVSVLRHAAPAQPDSEWAQDVIDRQVTHLVRLVDDLLDVSRITSGKIRLKSERLELSRVIHSAVETSRPLMEAAGHRFVLSLPGEQVCVQGDHARLSQVFSNLLNNAAKYTPQGGSIALTARLEGDQIAVRVRDTGIGIPAEMLPRVFDLFTQADQSLDRSQGGLGIGLTLVQRLVTMHGGTVYATSGGTNCGSEFSVLLPVVSAPAPPAMKPLGSDAATKAARCRVLVVDDNRDAADTLATLLRIEGHEIRTAYDGAVALKTAAEFRPDACILDLGLPGMSGFEVARQIVAHPPVPDRLPLLVAVSGYGQPEDQRRSKEAGFHYHFTKPVDHRQLLDLLAEAAKSPELRVNGSRSYHEDLDSKRPRQTPVS